LPWDVEAVNMTGSTVELVLGLSDNAYTRQLWDVKFKLTYRIRVSSALEMKLKFENRSDQSVKFEEALHTYLTVSDVREATVNGLDGSPYLDRADKATR